MSKKAIFAGAVIIAIFLSIFIMIAGNAQTTDVIFDYNDAINFLDGNIYGSFVTNIEPHNNEPIPATLFEDGSWVVGSYRGCLKGWSCDELPSTEFPVIYTCQLTAMGENPYLNNGEDTTLQTEESCIGSFDAVTIAHNEQPPEADEDLGGFETNIRFITGITEGQYTIFLPVVRR